MVAVELERIEAVILWINHYGQDERLRLPPVKKLTEIWQKHLLAVATLIEAREPGPCSVASPVESYELALGVLQGTDDQKSSDQRGRVKSLKAEKAASGNETEIYKFLVLFLHEIALFSKEWIQKFIPALQQQNLEGAFARLLEQCANHVDGDTWWRSEPFTPNRDIILTPVRNVSQTPKVRKISQSKFCTREEVFSTDDIGSPIKNLLNSPRINEMRIEQYTVKERKLNEKIHLLEEEKMTLEEKLTFLRKESGDLNLSLHDFKQKTSDLERELVVVNNTNKKLLQELEELEKEKRLLQKQSEDRTKNVDKYKGYLEDSEAQRIRITEECNQLQLVISTNKEELTFLRDEKQCLTSENNDLRRKVATLEKQLQDLSIKLDSANKDLQDEKNNSIEKLKAKEYEMMMLLEDERNLRIDAHKEQMQAEEKLADAIERYNASLEREKTSSLIYKQQKEQAEEKLLIKKREFDEIIEEVKSSHEREVTTLKEFKDYYEKKYNSLSEEMEILSSDLCKTKSENSNRESSFLESMKSLKVDLEKAEIERKALKANMVQRDDQIEQVKNEFSEYTIQKDAQISSLEEALAAKDEKVSFLESEYATMVSVLLESEGKMDSIKEFMEEVFAENNALHEEINRLKIEPIEEEEVLELETGESLPIETVNESIITCDLKEVHMDDTEQFNSVLPDVNEDEEPCEMFSTMLDGTVHSSTFLPPRESRKEETPEEQPEDDNKKPNTNRCQSNDSSIPNAPKLSPKEKETDRSRLMELQERNKQVPNALRCSYALETMNYPSPTGAESNIKGKSTGGKAFMRRLTSSIMTNKKGKENEETSIQNKNFEKSASRGTLVNRNF